MIHLDLHAVCIGTIKEIAPGKRSAIDKHPVREDVVEVGELGIEGDQQKERRLYFGRMLHGGPEKAIHAYPHEHLPVWSEIAEREVLPGNLGENLSIGGILEDEVHVGDEWAWGEVLLRVTEPRTPCSKLDVVLGRPVKRTMLHGTMTGWYLSVLRPGTAPTAGAIEVVSRGTGPTIADVLRGRKASRAS
jgi:MOSC domain-containing protein YiiM